MIFVYFKERIENTFPTITEIKHIYKSLCLNFQIAKGELIEESFEFNLLAFAERYKTPVNKVVTTLNLLEANGIMQVSDGYHKKSTVQFLSSSKQILNYSKSESKSSKVIQLIT